MPLSGVPSIVVPSSGMSSILVVEDSEHPIAVRRSTGWRQWGVLLLASATLGLFLLDLTLPRSIVPLACYGIAAVIASGSGQPRQVALLSGGAMALGVASSLRHAPLSPVAGAMGLLGLGVVCVVALRVACQRRRLELNNRQLQERCATLDATLPGVLFEFAPAPFGGGHFRFIGSGSQELLELEPERLMENANAFWRLVHPVDLQRVRDQEARARGEGRSFSIDLRMTTPSGRRQWLTMIARPLTGKGDTAVLWGGVLLDITERKRADDRLLRSHGSLAQAQEHLRQERGQLRATLDSLLDPHLVLRSERNDQGAIVAFHVKDANAAACQLLQLPLQELLGLPLEEVAPTQMAGGWLATLADRLERRRPLQLDSFAGGESHRDPPQRFYDIRAVPMDADHVCLTWRDVSERVTANRRIAASEAQYRLLAENSFDVVMRLQGGHITWVSPSLTAMLGWLPQEWIGRRDTDFLDPSNAEQYAANLERLNRGESVVARDRIRARDGSWHWIETHVRPYRDPDGPGDDMVASFRTVDAEVEVEQELEKRACTDELTGLLNRREVLHRIEAITPRIRRANDELAVLFCDLDRFKSINDSHGHAAGDEVLIAMAQRIRACLRGDDLAARIGGDELLVVLRGVRDLEDAIAIAEKIRTATGQPIPTRSGSVTVTLSIGVTLTRSEEPIDGLIARADGAMYQAKALGRNRVIPIAEEAQRPAGEGQRHARNGERIPMTVAQAMAPADSELSGSSDIC